MKLFELEENFQVALNKEWLMLTPEFATLIKRDKGSAGDYRGDKKLKAIKELTFIYFDLDFASPIREWKEGERHNEALHMAGLEEKDLDDKVMEAHRKYDQLMQKASRSLRTLRAVEQSLDQLDQYYETLDFNERDKKGEMVHNPATYLMNLKRLDEGYDAVEKFRKRVARELKGGESIRGNARLGQKEGRREQWKESSPEQIEEGAAEAESGSIDYRDISVVVGEELNEEEG